MLASFARRSRLLTVPFAAVAALGLSISVSDARPGGGKSFGSRGDRTFQAPPTTNTAPKAAQPVERSMTQPGALGASGAAAGASQAAKGAAVAGAAQAARPSMMRNLLLGGLMGAGLATLFGAGAFANVLGFLLQGLLIGGLLYLALMFIRSRFSPQPATAAASAGAAPTDTQANYRQAMGRSAIGTTLPPLQISGDDFNAFERLLGDVQSAYGRNDVKALEPMTTPEMLSYFAEELHGNDQRGVRNEISEPKLLQGDLSESWREGNRDYATVAMRYAIVDVTRDVASGRVISGNASTAQEVTEIWTFVRPNDASADQWELSAIQQA